MSDPFDNLDFHQELDPANWTHEGTTLHTPTFEALLKPDGTLWLSGPALAEGFSVEAAQALTRFLSERVRLPEVSPVYDFKDFIPTPVEEDEATRKRDQAIAAYQEAHPFVPDADDTPVECPNCHRQTTKAGLIYLPDSVVKCDICHTLPRMLQEYEQKYGGDQS